MMSESFQINYHHSNGEPPHGHEYLWPPILRILENRKPSRVFDLGCGNGSFASKLLDVGFEVAGVDPSAEGIARAKDSRPELLVETGSAYEPLVNRFGKFGAVVSQEVIGHVYDPRKFVSCVKGLLEPGGIAIISTPYHGYWKNLALCLAGKWDAHHTALWDHGIIKFWSVETLTELFAEVGLLRVEVHRVGRFPILAKSMILVFRSTN